MLLMLNGFFTAAEFALVKLRSSRLEEMLQEGSLTAKAARVVTGNMDASIFACQLGITMASLGLGWLGMPFMTILMKPAFAFIGFSQTLQETAAWIVSFLIIVSLFIVIGRQLPKAVAVRQSETVTLRVSAPLLLFHKLMQPWLWLLHALSAALLRAVGLEKSKSSGAAHTEEELLLLMRESHESGMINQTELALVDNIFEFTETLAREIMIPRTDMECLYAELSFADNMNIALKEMRTRYPVCDPDKDHIIGFIHVKDLLEPRPEGSLSGLEIKSIVRPIIKVPDSMQASQLLRMMQKRKIQMALLIDEYGGTSGLVTLEDILEEIVGEIQDEFDEERPRIEKRDDHTFSIDGRMLIDEVNDYFGLSLESSDFDTIGGWISSQVELPPRKQQQASFESRCDFIIEEVDHMRISRVLVRVHSAQPRTA